MSSKLKTRKNRRKAKKLIKESKVIEKVISSGKPSAFRENIFGAPKAIATGWNSTDTSPMQMSFHHKSLGKGLRVTGSELLGRVDANPFYAGAIFNYLWDTTSTGTTPGYSGFIGLNPLMISQIQQSGMQRLAFIATNYTRYRYRKIQIEYIPTTGTDQSQSFMFGIIGGFPTVTAGQAGAPGWFYDTSQLSPSMAVPSYGRGVLNYTYEGDMTWQVNSNKDILNASFYGDATLLDITTQCTLAAAAFYPTTFTPFTYGMVRMSYVLELFDPTAPTFNLPLNLVQLSSSLREKITGLVTTAISESKLSHLARSAPLTKPREEVSEKDSLTPNPPLIPEHKERSLKDIPKSVEVCEPPPSRPVLRRS